ncbi:MAG: DUF5667 domain-containing protein, partial [Candidatus Nanohaloarchaea archaeon]
MAFAIVGTAQTGSPAVIPSHPLYAAKIAGETAVESMAPNDTARIRAKLRHAGNRANESLVLANKNMTELANETAEDYAQKMQEVNDLGQNISDLAQSGNISQVIARATQHHAKVLSTVYERVPEQAKAAIGRALNRSVKGHDMAVQAMRNHGMDTSKFNITSRIPSDVRGRVGIPASPGAAAGRTAPRGSGG